MEDESENSKISEEMEIIDLLTLPNNNGRSLLHFAASLGVFEVVEILVKADSRKKMINMQDDKLQTPLRLASDKGYIDIIKFLVDNGADVNLADDWGRTALHYAVKQEVAELLINLGANVNALEKIGYTPLHTEAAEGYLYMCEFLIKAGAKVNAVDRFGNTPIDLAVSNKRTAVAVFLIMMGAEELCASGVHIDFIEYLKFTLKRCQTDVLNAILGSLRDLGYIMRSA